jgi:membrane protein YqaA with SNARE-associated domain
VRIVPFLILVATGKGLRYVVFALAVEGAVTP